MDDQSIRAMILTMPFAIACHRLEIRPDTDRADYRLIAANATLQTLFAGDLAALGNSYLRDGPGYPIIWHPADREPAVSRPIGPCLASLYDGFRSLGAGPAEELYDPTRQRWFEVVVFSPADDYYAVSFRDITDNRLRVNSLLQKTALFNQLVDAIPDLTFFKDLNGIYLGCNQAFSHYVNKPISSIIGATDKDLFDLQTAEQYTANDQVMIRSGQSRYNTEWLTYADGTRILVDTLKSPIFDRHGEIIGVLGLSRDVTVQYQMAEKLRSSVENFEVFFETMDDMIFITNEQGQIIYTNQSVSLKTGFSPEEAKSMHVLDFNPPDKRAEAEQIFADMFAGRRSICPLPLICKNGRQLPAETRVWFGKWDNEPCMFGIVKDLTKEQESLQRFNKIFEMNPALMAISTLEDRVFSEVNRSYLSCLGYSIDELIGHTAQELNLFVDLGRHEEVTRTLKAEGKITNVELQVRKKNGEILTGLFAGEIIESQGQQYLLTVMIDITQQKAVEQTLIYLSELQQTLMKISTDYINLPMEQADAAVILSLRDIGQFVDADRAYIFSYDFELGTTSNTFEWCRAGISPQIDELQQVPLKLLPEWVATHRQGRMMQIPDVMALPADNGVRQILEPQEVKSLITLPMMAGSDCIGFVGFDSVTATRTYTEKERILLSFYSQMLVNLRNRQQQEAMLKAATERAEQANQSKSQFLAIMSHEIRTPMNGMLGYLQILQNQETDPSHLTYINKINDSAQTLLTVINDILDISKIEAGKLTVEQIPFNLPDLAQAASQVFAAQAQEKGLRLGLQIAANGPQTMMGDPTRLRQILTNLLSNAVKFTSQGEVSLTVDIQAATLPWTLTPGSAITEQTAPAVEDLVFIIQDTGIGMSESTIQSLFQPFMQADHSSTRKFGGSGLGLSISRNLVTLMGGSITVASQIGHGSCFTVRIPLRRAADQAGTAVPVADQRRILPGARILLVEDNEINQEIARQILENAGLTVDTVGNGREAVAAVQRDHYHAVLMDIQMPVMDGYAATREIRRNPSLADLPVIAMTAGAMAIERENAREAGMNDYIAKPIDFLTLYQVLARWIRPV